MFTTEPLPKDLEFPEAKQFVADYKAKYGAEPESVWWVMAADAYRVIAEAITQTKSSDPAVLADYLHKRLQGLPRHHRPHQRFRCKRRPRGGRLQSLRDHRHGEIQPNPQQPSLQ